MGDRYHAFVLRVFSLFDKRTAEGIRGLEKLGGLALRPDARDRLHAAIDRHSKGAVAEFNSLSGEGS